MNKFQRPLTILFFTLMFASSAVTADAADRTLYLFGDSWAELIGYGQIDQELTNRQFDDFITIDKRGISGSTLADWVEDDRGLLDEIAADPNPNPIAFFILGGNDLLQGTGTPEQMTADLETIVAKLHEVRDDLEIVYAGYDILNPDVDVRCTVIFSAIFDSTDSDSLQSTLYDLLAPAQALVSKYSRLTVVDTFGSLQGRPGDPDFTQASATGYLADCIHLNNAGYDVYLDTVFNDALTPLICADDNVTTIGCDGPLPTVTPLPPTDTPPPPTDTPQPATATPEQAEEEGETRPSFIVGSGLILLGAIALIASLFAGIRHNE